MSVSESGGVCSKKKTINPEELTEAEKERCFCSPVGSGSSRCTA